jgi:hypothetical protein
MLIAELQQSQQDLGDNTDRMHGLLTNDLAKNLWLMFILFGNLPKDL